VSAIPELPLIVKGEVKVDGKDAPTGTEIRAEMDEKQAATFAVAKEGEFAFTINRNDAVNKTVSFYVNDMKAEQTAMWGSGEVEELNLSVGKQGRAWWYVTGIVIAAIIIGIIISFKYRG